jgi:hypothetical protein
MCSLLCRLDKPASLPSLLITLVKWKSYLPRRRRLSAAFIVSKPIVARPIEVRPKMTTPFRSKWSSHLSSRGVKQPHQRPAFLVNPTQVETFVQIAVVTCEREIFTVVPAAVPASYDVLPVVGKERLRLLRHSAVLAASFKGSPDVISGMIALAATTM